MMKRLALLLLTFAALTTPARAQNTIAKRPFGLVTVSFSATPTFDFSTSDMKKITLTGNVTSSTMTGMEAGQTVVFLICQDGTGGRTFAFPSQLQNPTTINAGIGVCTLELFEYDGTNAYPPPGSGGSGSGTVSNCGTGKQFAIYAASGTTVSCDTNLDDGLTTVNTLTYLGSGGIAAVSFTGTAAGAFVSNGTEGSCGAPVAGHDIYCAGDSISHTAQISNNGQPFLPAGLWASASSNINGVMYATGTFPQYSSAAAGNAGQAIISSGSASPPGPAALNLAGGSTIFTGILPKANHPTSVIYGDQTNAGTAAFTLDASLSTTAAAIRLPNIGGVTESSNGAMAYDSTNNLFKGGLNGADSFFVNSSAAPANNDCPKWVVSGGNKTLGTTGAACGAGASIRLDQILAATAGNTIANGDFAQVWQSQLTTASRHWFTLTETAASTSTGTPYLLDVHSIAASTANPLIVTALGTSNGWNLLNSGALWAPVGTGALATPGPAHNLVVSQAGAAAVTYVPPVTAGKVLIDNGPGVDPSFQDPIVSQAYVPLFTAIAATGTQTSSAVRNPVFSQTGTLQFTYASITGSPSGCTIQIQGVDSLGNALNNGSTFAATPANGTTSQTFTAAAGLQTAAQVKAIFACSVYASTGTLTLDFTPIPNVNVTNTVAVSGTVTTTPPSNASTNVTQFGGVAVSTGTGASGSGIPRVTIANDSALAANQSVNESQINGVTPLMGNGVTGTGAQRVTVSSDNSALPAAGQGATGSAVPAGVTMAGLSDGINARALAGDASGRQLVKIYPDTGSTSYHFSKKFAASSTTDVAVFPGNATNTLLIYRITLTCTQTTAGVINVELLKRSTADSGGTSAAFTSVPDDANYAAAVSAPLSYTGTGPSVGTPIGDLDNAQIGCNASATAGANDIYVFRPAKPIVLRGTAQQVAINLGGAVTGGNISITVDTVETTTP